MRSVLCLSYSQRLLTGHVAGSAVQTSGLQTEWQPTVAAHPCNIVTAGCCHVYHEIAVSKCSQIDVKAAELLLRISFVQALRCNVHLAQRH